MPSVGKPGQNHAVHGGADPTAAKDLCWNCQSTPGGEYFCESCIKIQPVSRETDYFACFGLPRALDVDLEDLERRFFELSRKFHPDYFQQKSEDEKAISLENAATVNTAYRTLKDPVRRAEYLIRLEEGSAKTIESKAPADLLEEILEIQESLEAYQSAVDQGDSAPDLRAKIEQERDRLVQRDKKLEEELFGLFNKWDAIKPPAAPEAKLSVLKAIKGNLAHRSYLETLLEDLGEGLKKGSA